MLKFRLEYLNDIVDYFVLVESKKTFVGKSKDLFFEKSKNLFEEYSNKIIHIIVDNESYSNPWINEKNQRNSIDNGIKKLTMCDDDIIIISDVDEIPDKNTLREIKEKENFKIGFFNQDLYYYNLTCKFNGKWKASKICTYEYYKNINLPQVIRNTGGEKIEKGGWHFSYFGDVNFIKNKIENFSHQEYNNSEFTNINHIENMILNGKDLYKRENKNITYTTIKIEDNDYLPDNYEKLLKINNIN